MDARRVADHYDELSPFYREIWGEHIHHGLYRTGDESRAEATEALLELLVERLRIGAGDRVLDIGCGVGGTARHLVASRGCRVVGVTISSVQARMARETVRSGTASRSSRFVVGDAARLPLRGSFDAALALEVLSHVDDRSELFDRLAGLVRPGGRIGIAAWLRADELTSERDRRTVARIEEGMLVRLPTLSEYRRHFETAGLREVFHRDVSAEVAPTWDLCLELVADPGLWSLARQKGGDVLSFLGSFRAMRAGFASGAFRYAALVAERP